MTPSSRGDRVRASGHTLTKLSGMEVTQMFVILNSIAFDVYFASLSLSAYCIYIFNWHCCTNGGGSVILPTLTNNFMTELAVNI